MIINVQNGKDVITVDVRCRQIRYLKDIARKGNMLFYDMGQTTAECYEFLFNNKQQLFLSSLAEDVTNNMPVEPVDPANLKVLTRDEYLAVCAGR
jgi:hypothetical protein